MTAPIIAPCEICNMPLGMVDKTAQHLCPRCAREMLLADGMSEQLQTAVRTHILPQLHELVRTWAAYWQASGLLAPDDAVGTAEWGLSQVLSDPLALARQALQSQEAKS